MRINYNPHSACTEFNFLQVYQIPHTELIISMKACSSQCSNDASVNEIIERLYDMVVFKFY